MGHGTTFRIDPWSRCATAFHVVEDLFEPTFNEGELALREHIRLAALELNSLILGSVPIPDGAWRPIADSFAIYGIERKPFTEVRLRNFTEMMVLRPRPSKGRDEGTPFLTVDFRGWRPRENEQVMAFGYADLDVDHNCAGESRPMEQYLYGSLGRIIQVDPADPTSGRPWSRIRVDAEWPGGMSGGLVKCGQDRGEIEAMAREYCLTDVCLVAFAPLTGDYLRA